jgi:hypothetical protein
MQAGTEASRYSRGSGRKEHVVRTDDAGLSGVQTVWHVVLTDGTVDRWVSGRDASIVRTADRELEFFNLFRRAESLENALISGIPVYNIFTHK